MQRRRLCGPWRGEAAVAMEAAVAQVGSQLSTGESVELE